MKTRTAISLNSAVFDNHLRVSGNPPFGFIVGFEIGAVFLYIKDVEIQRIPHSMQGSNLVNLFPKYFLFDHFFCIFNDLVKNNSIQDKYLRMCTEKKEKGAVTAVNYHSLLVKDGFCTQNV